MTQITVVDDITTKDAEKVISYAIALSRMSDAELSQEYMDMMVGRKTKIEKTQMKHEMSKRFFTQWATTKLNR